MVSRSAQVGSAIHKYLADVFARIEGYEVEKRVNIRGNLTGTVDILNSNFRWLQQVTGINYDEPTYREDHRTIVPSPWPAINELIQGGLGNGDLGLIFGSPGGGKSWTLVALGGFAVKMGYNVIHYTLELSESYTGRRYDAFFTGLPVDSLDKNKDQVNDMMSDLKGELIIKEYPMGKTTINTIESHIQKVKDLGIEPDLILIDYIDIHQE